LSLLSADLLAPGCWHSAVAAAKENIEDKKDCFQERKGINARLTASFDKNGEVEKVEISYPEDPVAQYLNYGAMYDAGLTR